MARGGKREGAGRPSGAANKSTLVVKEAAQAFTADALEVLASIMRGTEHPAAARVSAASAILDRGHGKPKQEVEASVTANVEVPDARERLARIVAGQTAAVAALAGAGEPH